jgi:hypothetical protein
VTPKNGTVLFGVPLIVFHNGWITWMNSRDVPFDTAAVAIAVLGPVAESCIVPRTSPTRRVLFLPDPQRTAVPAGQRSVRRPVVNDPALLAYLATFDQEAQLFARGTLDEKSGAQRLAPADVGAYERVVAQRIQLQQSVQSLYPEWGP